MKIFHAVHPRFENMFHCSEVSIGVTSGVIVCSEFQKSPKIPSSDTGSTYRPTVNNFHPNCHNV